MAGEVNRDLCDQAFATPPVIQKPNSFKSPSEYFFETFSPLAFEEPKVLNDSVPKKPPTAFITRQDWSLYVRVCCHLRQIRTQYGCSDEEAYKRFPKDGQRRGSCIVRLIAAFNRLYGEYVFLCDAIESENKEISPNISSSNGSRRKSRNRFSDNKRFRTRRKRNNLNELSLLAGDGTTMDSIYENMQQQQQQPQNQIKLNVKYPGTLKNLQLPCTPTDGSTAHSTDTCSTRLPSASPSVLTSHFTQTPAFDEMSIMSQGDAQKSQFACLCHKPKKPKHPKTGPNSVGVYDCLQRSLPETSVWVSQLTVKSPHIEHIVDCAAKEGSKKKESIRLPIGLELCLPRIQRVIEVIMSTCRFVFDPLEVMAELRTVNYDVHACIDYFEKSRFLRDIIQEFLPTGSFRAVTAHNSSASHNQNSTQPQLKLFGMTSEELEAFLLHYKESLQNIRKLQKDAHRRIQRVHLFASGLFTVVQQIVPNGAILTMDPQNANENHALGGQVAQLISENATLKETLKVEEEKRKSIFNMMQEYLGNIRVFCRCRSIPQTSRCLDVVSFDTITLNNGSNSEEYKFDRIFDVNATQAEIYMELVPLVCSFMDGFNVSFLTYGGEASGKTYTLLGGLDGNTESEGIVHRALRTVLDERASRKNEWDMNISVAVIEVYNDVLIDLLSGESGIHLRVDVGVDRMMGNLKTVPIDSDKEVDDLLQLCNSRRKSARTALNPASSRSHLIMLARLQAVSNIHETKISSVLALCDLAGFEDIIKADTLGDHTLAKEAGFINRSLTALNRVFTSLRTQNPMAVSYRDSKLTYLLKPFFTNSGKCILIVTVRTDRANLPSTQGTLRFGRDSRTVSLGRARRQISMERLIQDVRAV